MIGDAPLLENYLGDSWSPANTIPRCTYEYIYYLVLSLNMPELTPGISSCFNSTVLGGLYALLEKPNLKGSYLYSISIIIYYLLSITYYLFIYIGNIRYILMYWNRFDRMENNWIPLWREERRVWRKGQKDNERACLLSTISRGVVSKAFLQLPLLFSR